MIAIYTAIKKKGINQIHPRKEMEISKPGLKADAMRMAEQGYVTSNMVNNLTKARAHGLIAKVKGNAGSYVITFKGQLFLKGEFVPKKAIRSKTEKHTVGYGEESVTMQMLLGQDTFWDSEDFTIKEGCVYAK